jgi:cytochrome c-type biogenesis protein CcmH/NrfG
VAALALLVLAVYWPVAQGGLIWDDSVMLSDNPLVQAPDGWWRVWVAAPGPKTPDYFPLTSFLFWLQYHAWGHVAGGYHAVNVALHFVNCLLLWRVLKALRIPAAWLVAAVFAVHPANVPSVAWIAELKNQLAMLFYLGTLQAWLRFEDDGSRRRYAAALGLFALGCLSKGSVVVLPPVLLLLAWWRRDRIAKADVVRSLPFFGLALASGIVTMVYQYRPDGGLPLDAGWQFVNGLAVSGRAVWFYLANDLLPVNPCAVYPLWHLDLSLPETYLPTLALAAAFALLLWKRRTWWGRPLLFGLAYFVITMFPLLGFLPTMYMQFSFVADHWQYLSLAGVIALPVGAGVAAAGWEQGGAGAARGKRKKPQPAAALRPFRAGMAVLAALGLAGLAALACRHAWAYSDGLRLWQDTMTRNPDAYVAYNNYASDALARGRCSAKVAAGYFREAVRRNPGYSEGWKNLAQAYAALGKTDEALDACRRIRFFNPRGERIRASLATEVLVLYGTLAQGKGDNTLARNCFDEALRLDPRCQPARFNLALLLASTGAAKGAAAEYRRLLEQDPDNHKAANNLAWLLAASPDPSLRNPREAESLARRALAASANTEERSNHLDTLAVAQAANGRFAEAARTARTAVALARKAKAPPVEVAEMEKRLRLYEKGQSWFDPALGLRKTGDSAEAK